MWLEQIIKNIFSNKTETVKNYYSQNGEDLILIDIIRKLKFPQSEQFYLDIGANHPKELSNSYLFYQNGFSGVLVEPDPLLAKALLKERPNDKIIHAGIGPNSVQDFYIMSNHTLNTFSKEEADNYCKMDIGYSVKSTLKIELLDINTVIKNNFSTYPEIISIDVEGYEMKILDTFDFKKYKPAIFCIETYSWRENRIVTEIINLMTNSGYKVYITLGANTIFLREDLNIS
jgi:FkbM family methyltransferase